MAELDLLEQVLVSWRANAEVTLRLASKVTAKGLAAVPPGSRGRDVGRQFVHLYNVRVRWMQFNNAPEGKLKILSTRRVPTTAQLRTAFKSSGTAVEKYIRRMIMEDKRVKFFKGQPVRWMSYMIAHESHHRGSIMLTLKQNGMRMPDDVAMKDVWMTWYSGNV